MTGLDPRFHSLAKHQFRSVIPTLAALPLVAGGARACASISG
jgi:hypothetical protein